MAIKDNLADLLAQRGMTPTQLAAETGLAQPTVHRILSGESASPRIENLRVFAKYFGVSIADLTGEKAPAASPVPQLNAKAARIALHLSALPEHKLDALAVVLGIKL